MKYCIYIFLFQLIVFAGISQNLVPNWSFEDTISCPDDQAQINKTPPWRSPSRGSPDLFHSCNTGNFGVPNNLIGSQFANTGEAFCGIHVNKFNNRREYIQAKLIDSLRQGYVYYISYYVSLPEDFNYTINNLGVLFTVDTFTIDTFENIPYIPQLENDSTNPLTSKTNWMEVRDTFVGSGGEQCITIGNFRRDSSTDAIWVGGGVPFSTTTFFYIDDVSIIPCTNDTTFTYTICKGDSMLINGNYEKTTGVYKDTLPNTMGCDSIIITNLFVEYYQDTTDTTIALGDSIYLQNAWQDTAGTYYDTLQTVNLCDSVIITTLSIDSCAVTDTTTINPEICQGQTYTYNTKNYSTAGIYYDTLKTSPGCDSIIEIQLTVNNVYTLNEDTSIMQGDSIYLSGAWQKLQDTYYDSLQTIKLCDSIIITNLTIIPLPENDSIIIYNTFTPNGDGVNETFYIKNITKYPENKLTIFNRWGSVVWEKTGYMNEWSGTGVDNEKLATGVYYYVLVVDGVLSKGYVLVIK